jgi:Domain of unknown function (DUF4160)
MPTILREQGFRVVIYPNDHLPSHIHVLKGSGEVRIDLGDEESDPSLISITGQISDKDIAKALYLMKENQAKLLAKWREIHE